LGRLASFIAPAPDDVFVEVGAGGGALSIRLAPLALRLFAVEIDRDLHSCLAAALAGCRNAELVGKDILTLDLGALVAPVLRPGAKLRIVGNLPYNIGTAVIERILSLDIPLEDMVFVLQLEVTKRIGARPGSKDYGFFSVFCQHFCEIRPGFRIAPQCFSPPPKVYSAAVRMKPRSRERDPDFEKAFLACAKAAFAYRRKGLANSLRHSPRFEPLVGELLARAGIDGYRRAEQLSLEEHERLASAFRTLEAAQRPASTA
jgi:16S rRNA (adenine1518-N6/adenine1519-N6)-dimethyltransferase